MDGSYFRDKENHKCNDETSSFLQGPEGSCGVQRILSNTKGSKGSHSFRRVLAGPDRS